MPWMCDNIAPTVPGMAFRVEIIEPHSPAIWWRLAAEAVERALSFSR